MSFERSAPTRSRAPRLSAWSLWCLAAAVAAFAPSLAILYQRYGPVEPPPTETFVAHRIPITLTDRDPHYTWRQLVGPEGFSLGGDEILQATLIENGLDSASCDEPAPRDQVIWIVPSSRGDGAAYCDRSR